MLLLKTAKKLSCFVFDGFYASAASIGEGGNMQSGYDVCDSVCD